MNLNEEIFRLVWKDEGYGDDTMIDQVACRHLFNRILRLSVPTPGEFPTKTEPKCEWCGKPKRARNFAYHICSRYKR